MCGGPLPCILCAVTGKCGFVLKRMTDMTTLWEVPERMPGDAALIVSDAL